MDAFKALQPLISHPLQEELFVILLTNHGKVIAIKLMGLGSDTSVIFPIKLIAREAVINVASQVIIAHTHPSRDVMPSIEDCNQTEKLHKALKLLDIILVDHLILGENKYYGFSEEKIVEL